MDGCSRSLFCFVTVSSWGEGAGEVKLLVETRQHEHSAGCAEDGADGATPSPFTAPSTNSWSISILGSMRLINAQCCFWQVDDRIGWHFLNRIWWKNFLEKVWESVRKDFCEHNLMKRKYFLCVLEAASQGLWRKFGEFRVSCSWFKAFMKLKEKLFMKIIRGKGCLWCKESCLWWEFKQKMARTRQELLMKKIRGKQG